jgi:hypothetical protein
MSVNNKIKEFKNWFVRTTHLPAGTKPDQEVGYPLTRFIDGVARRQRFHSLDFPSQTSYEKMLSSLLGALEWEDRAKDSDDVNYMQNGNVLGGHVTVATDFEAIGMVTDLGVLLPERTEIGVNGNESKYTRVPRTSQLPTVEDVENTSETPFFFCNIPTVVPIAVTVDYDPTVTTRNKYLVESNDAFETWLKDAFEALRAFLFELNIDQYTTGLWTGTAGVTYNNSADGEIIIGETSETCEEYKKFQIGVDIKDIVLVDGTVSGTINGSPASGTVKWTEVSPREWRADVTVNA